MTIRPGTMAPSAPDIGGVSEQQLRQACAELDRRLRAGEACRAERFLAQTPLLASQEDWAVELVYTEFVAREELGHRPTPEEYYARFPRWKGRLSRQFQVHELLREGLVATAPAGPVPAPALPRVRLGRFEVLEEVARGGCGVVYKGWQPGLERVVALKALLPEYGHLLRARRRFSHEARVMASLRHRHIMPVHDIGESDGVIYFSMDWAAGGSLASGRQGGWEPRRLVALLETVARAVHHAHERGVIHCDLKPSNILLDDLGEPLVSDFGLARLPTGAGDLDGPGEVVGTPAYMAPEQLDGHGEAVGPATDVWALGVVLYELRTGRRPFVAGTLADLQTAISLQEPAPFGENIADPAVEAVCRRCLAKDPARRYPSAAELAEALNSYLAR
jgi:hypothetical protein